MSKTTPAPEQQAFLDELAKLWPLAKGSLAAVRKPCIRANCPACRAGRKHQAWIFSFTAGGRRRCLYVPAEFAAVVRQALANGRRVERLLVELGGELIHRHRRGRG